MQMRCMLTFGTANEREILVRSHVIFAYIIHRRSGSISHGKHA